MTREEAIKMLKSKIDGHTDTSYEWVETVRMSISALEKERTGHWIKTIGENGVTSAVRCSECGFEDNRYMLFRYCPNCGAKMERSDKE